MLTLSTIAQWIGADRIGSDDAYQSICIDSRQCRPGDLFVAIRGEHFDGHQFIAEVGDKGAIGCVVERPIKTSMPQLVVKDSIKALGQFAHHFRMQYAIPIVAITGSCDKTTVKEMLASILSLQGEVLVTEGNQNNELGVPLTLLRLEPKHAFAVIEMGARHPGDIAYLTSIVHPAVSVITNVGLAHVGVFGDVLAIAKAKGEIYQGLPIGGTAIVNADDRYAGRWKQSMGFDKKYVTFGHEHQADIMASQIQLENKFCSFELITGTGKVAIHLPVPGRHNIQNALAAASIAYQLGIPLTLIQSGLANFSGISGRLQFKPGLRGVTIIDDTYNANPISLRVALQVLSTHPEKKWLVLGDMFELGDQSAEWHKVMGQEAKAFGVEKVLALGELTQETVKGFGPGAIHYHSRKDLIEALLEAVDSDIIVLVKGSRGMAMEKVVDALTEKRKEANT